jgi:SAM-dependent methyltransferase
MTGAHSTTSLRRRPLARRSVRGHHHEDQMQTSWDQSAEAWIAFVGQPEDMARRCLDPELISRIEGRGFADALDVGCGEGRFCRILRQHGIAAHGIDPTRAFIDHARAADPDGCYDIGCAEALPYASGSFGLVVSYMSLLDIPDIDRAIGEMARVLRPGGTLLVGNSTSMLTAGVGTGWAQSPEGEFLYYKIDRYLEPRVNVVEFSGIKVENYHRPLCTYVKHFLAQGLELKDFSEPAPAGEGVHPLETEFYSRVPWFVVMEWRKPLET